MNVDGPAVESRLHRKQPADLPSVSILLLTLNGMPEFEKCLQMLEVQDYTGDIEMLLIDSGSTDGTLEAASKFGLEAHAIEARDFHHGRTRNHAAAMAHNEILVLLTQDAVPGDEHWLSSLVAPFEDATVGGAYGRQVAPETLGSLRRYALEYEYPLERQVRALDQVEKPHLGMFRMSNANSAIRTELWRQFKFDETVIMSEDVGMCRDLLMAGHRVVYEPGATVIHGHERSLWHEFQWAVDSGISLKRKGILGNPDMGSELKYGLERIAEEWKHFTARRMYFMAVQGLCISIARGVGVQIGKREARIPIWFLARLSPGVRHEQQRRGLSPGL